MTCRTMSKDFNTSVNFQKLSWCGKKWVFPFSAVFQSFNVQKLRNIFFLVADSQIREGGKKCWHSSASGLGEFAKIKIALEGTWPCQKDPISREPISSKGGAGRLYHNIVLQTGPNSVSRRG